MAKEAEGSSGSPLLTTPSKLSFQCLLAGDISVNQLHNPNSIQFILALNSIDNNNYLWTNYWLKKRHFWNQMNDTVQFLLRYEAFCFPIYMLHNDSAIFP